MKKIKYIATIAIALATMGLASQISATTLAIGDSHELGFVNYGIPSGDADRTTYVNHLIDMLPGTSDSADGQDYTRSTNFFGSLSDAVWAKNGTGTSVDLGTTGYLYLFAKYDGPNYGSEVWYVGDLSGVITIPGTAGEQGYGLSTWTLFNPGSGAGGGGNAVPEGGTSLALLGASVAALFVVRRLVVS